MREGGKKREKEREMRPRHLRSTALAKGERGRERSCASKCACRTVGWGGYSSGEKLRKNPEEETMDATTLHVHGP